MEIFLFFFSGEFFSRQRKIEINDEIKDDESPPNSAVLSPISVPPRATLLSHTNSYSQIISPNVNNQNHQPMIMNNSQNGNLVPHSQSAHQLGHQGHQQQQQLQQPHTPLASHHQILQQQLQKHFQHNNMGECSKALCILFFYAIWWENGNKGKGKIVENLRQFVT